MAELIFPHMSEVLQLQADLIDEFGGIHGIRDEGAFESAMAAAENRYHYETEDLAKLSATFAYHLSQAHAFLDGNKRIATAVTGIFLKMNGAKLDATNSEIIRIFLDIAAGRLSRDEVEQAFKAWIILC